MLQRAAPPMGHGDGGMVTSRGRRGSKRRGRLLFLEVGDQVIDSRIDGARRRWPARRWRVRASPPRTPDAAASVAVEASGRRLGGIAEGRLPNGRWVAGSLTGHLAGEQWLAGSSSAGRERWVECSIAVTRRGGSRRVRSVPRRKPAAPAANAAPSVWVVVVRGEDERADGGIGGGDLSADLDAGSVG
jgi:hypothetical protein